MKSRTIILLSTLLCACESKTYEFDRIVSEMTCPVVVVGKIMNPKIYSSIVVKDKTGRIATFSFVHDSGVSAEAIAESRQVGDTIKNCK